MAGERLITPNRSVIVAADVSDLHSYRSLVASTSKVEGISGYKVGFDLGLEYGLRTLVDTTRALGGDSIFMFDLQKAGNDIPEMGPNFARRMRQSGVDAAILFPFSSPKTLETWTKSLQDEGVHVLVGGHMTVPNFLESEGGFIADSAPARIYTQAAELGVRDFVVPGNKVDYVSLYREILIAAIGEEDFDLYAPGFIAQGGKISDAGAAAGRRFHAIVGSAIYKAQNMREAAALMTSQIA